MESEVRAQDFCNLHTKVVCGGGNSHLVNRLRDNTWSGCQTGYCFISNNASLEKKIIQGTAAHRQCTKEPAIHQNYDAWKAQ